MISSWSNLKYNNLLLQVIMDGGPTVQVVVNTPLPQIELIQGSVPEGDNNTMISSWGNLMQEKLLGDQLGVGYQSDQQLSTSNIVQQVPGPTGANPSMDSYPGEYGFTVIFHRLSDNIKNKSWDVSNIKTLCRLLKNRHILLSY